jgi:hypothetical protein
VATTVAAAAEVPAPVLGALAGVRAAALTVVPDAAAVAAAPAVIAGNFALGPAAFEVTMTSGIVPITGRVDSYRLARQLIDTVRHVDGVIEVRDRVTYPAEDAP